MLARKPHLSGDYRRETTPVATWLVCAIAGAFILQFVVDFQMGGAGSGLLPALSLAGSDLSSGRWWTILTFWLLHSTTNLFHVGIVIAGLHFYGRELIGSVGAPGFVGIFVSSLVGAGLTWSLAHWGAEVTLAGSTSALFGLAAVHAGVKPARRIRILVLFFFPLTLRPLHLLACAVSADLLILLLQDIAGRPLPFQYHPTAHLGGALAGWLWFRVWSGTRMRRDARPGNPGSGSQGLSSPPSDALRGETRAGTSGQPPQEQQSQAAVDRILDKINSHGLAALTPAERRILDAAGKQPRRR